MPAAAVTLRLARTSDATALALMSRDFIEAGLGWRYSPARIAGLIADRDHSALVACDASGSPQGFAVMKFGDEHAHLLLLAVRPARRRLGLGRALVDWLLASARVAGIAAVRLELRADNAGALAFYRRLGFVETGVVPAYYAAQLPARRMALRLRRSASIG